MSESVDSNIALILNTSAQPRDIELSSTLVPNPVVTGVKPFVDPRESLISKTFILSVDFDLPDLSALVTVPTTIISVFERVELNTSEAEAALTLLVVNPLPLDII